MPHGLLNPDLGLQDHHLTGSLKLTDGRFWGLNGATFSANLSGSDGGANVGLGLSGKAQYGLELEATAEINPRDPARSILSDAISSTF